MEMFVMFLSVFLGEEYHEGSVVHGQLYLLAGEVLVGLVRYVIVCAAIVYVCLQVLVLSCYAVHALMFRLAIGAKPTTFIVLPVIFPGYRCRPGLTMCGRLDGKRLH